MSYYITKDGPCYLTKKLYSTLNSIIELRVNSQNDVNKFVNQVHYNCVHYYKHTWQLIFFSFLQIIF